MSNSVAYQREQERIRRVRAAAFARFAAVWRVDLTVVRHVWFELEQQDFRDSRARRELEKIDIRISPRQIRYFRRRVWFLIKMDSWAQEGKRPANWSEILRRET